MRRRTTGRPPYALLPTLMLLFGLSIWGMSGGSQFLRGLGALSADPTEIADHIDNGIKAQRTGDTHGADDEFHRAALVAGGNAPAFVTVAETLIDRDFAPAAVNLLLPATKDESLSWDPMIWATLADAYRHADDGKLADANNTAAEKAAQKLYATATSNPLASLSDRDDEVLQLEELSVYYNEKKKDPARAIQILRIALPITPNGTNQPMVTNDLGYLLADKGTTPKEHAEAVTFTRQAVMQIDALAPGSPTAGTILDSYGWALNKTGDLEGARRVLLEASEDDPTEALVHYHLGIVYAALGAVADATIEFDRALLIQPTFEDAQIARKALPPIPASPSPQPSPSGLTPLPTTNSPPPLQS